MRRRDLLALAAGVTAWPFAGAAQQKPMPVIGFLGLATPGGFSPLIASFNEGLREAGYVEGRNVAVEYRWAEGHSDRLASLAAELVNRKVDVILTSGGVPAARAAKETTATIPIVFEVGVDPVERGLVPSYSRPEGNLTGVTILTGDLMPKRLEVLTELVPKARSIGLLVNPRRAPERTIGEVQAAAQAKGVQLYIVEAASEDQFESAFLSLAKGPAGALLVGNDAFFFSRRDLLVALAARHPIPAMYEWREFATAGGLCSYGTSLGGMYRQAGTYVGQILSGSKPADLPILRPTKFELVVNLKTAKALGLTVPQSILARADEVIE
jgi:putative tryptophan/tyrosine transport system substrate-binding protein